MNRTYSLTAVGVSGVTHRSTYDFAYYIREEGNAALGDIRVY